MFLLHVIGSQKTFFARLRRRSPSPLRLKSFLSALSAEALRVLGGQKLSPNPEPHSGNPFPLDTIPLAQSHSANLSSTLQTITAESSAPHIEDAGRQPSRPQKNRHIARYIVLTIAAFILTVWLDGLPTRLPSLGGTPARGERVGVIHVHTNASCGSGSLPQIIATARSANLSFLTVTDHNQTMAQADVAAADPPDFAVIDGEEVSTSSGHFLALGVDDTWPRGSSRDARSLMASTRRAHAVNFIAHPFGLRDRWGDWSVSDYDGIEIFNDDAVWRKNTVVDLVIAAVMYPVNPRLALLRLARTPQENFTKWDQLLQQRPVAGICGSDAHANIIIGQRSILKFPSYFSVFSLARQHVLLDNQPGVDTDHAGADVILNAIKSGDSFCSIDSFYPADGFTQVVTAPNTTATSPPGQTNAAGQPKAATENSKAISVGAETSPLFAAGPGQSIPWSPSAVLHIKTPPAAGQPILRVLRDGHEIVNQQTDSLDLPLPGPGHYRTEAYLQQPGLTGWHRWT